MSSRNPRTPPSCALQTSHVNTNHAPSSPPPKTTGSNLLPVEPTLLLPDAQPKPSAARTPPRRTSRPAPLPGQPTLPAGALRHHLPMAAPPFPTSTDPAPQQLHRRQPQHPAMPPPSRLPGSGPARLHRSLRPEPEPDPMLRGWNRTSCSWTAFVHCLWKTCVPISITLSSVASKSTSTGVFTSAKSAWSQERRCTG